MRRPALLSFVTLLVLAAFSTASGTAFAANPVSDLQRIGKDRTNSTNWSGYASINDTFTHSSGDWTVPQVDCSKMKGQQLAITTAFVGIDGYDSRTVEQTGTDSDCIGKTAIYRVWYEFYPAGAVFGDTGQYPVLPGDHMHADVTVSGGTVTTTLQNLSRSWSNNLVAQTSSSGLDLSSAEWIVEAPANKLAPFTTVNFFNAQANGNTIDTYDYDAITMVSKNGRTTRTTPSGLTDSGNSSAFSVTFNNP